MTTTKELPTTTETPDPGAWRELASGVEIWGPAWTPRAERYLTPEAVELVADLHRELDDERLSLLAERLRRQAEWDAGAQPGYLPDDELPEARGDWTIAPLPDDLKRRRVEITGPINDTKMVINMLSPNAEGISADAAMLDFEDSMMPAWANILGGLDNLAHAADGTLTFRKPATGGAAEKIYRLDPDAMPLLMVRCRGLHLAESNLRIDGRAVCGGLFDLALSVAHSAAALLARGRTPKYYVPKVEHYLEARWWNRLLGGLETRLGLSPSTLRATFLMETLPAAFQMEEILYELRDHAAGLNVGRWDKIFSDIKVLREHSDRVMADRASISMNRPWMRAYAERLIKICHRHGAFAMGGMAAFTPGRTAERRRRQTEKVIEDKRFEARLGHDGCWVSHPYFIGPALSAFGRAHQLDAMPPIGDRPDLLPVGTGPNTLAGLRTNVRVGIGYMKGWNEEIGCVAWDDLMEDLATLEISRAQTWQWLRHAIRLDDGSVVTRELVGSIFAEELAQIETEVRESLAGAERLLIEGQLVAFRGARADAERIFTETAFRPFLSEASALA